MIAKTLYRITRRNGLARGLATSLPALGGKVAQDKQPNMVIIGAQKSGTTSLHRFLNHHPDVFMPHFKEPGYFLDHTTALVEGTTRAAIRLGLEDKRLLRMMKFGYKGERWFGDGSTYYTMMPSMAEEVPANIATRSPEARLIYILRNPYERIVSQYLWGLQNGFATGTLDEVATRRFDIMTGISSYADQYERFAARIDPARILVLRFDALKKAPGETLNTVTSFLDIPPLNLDPSVFAPQNISRERKQFTKDQLEFSDAMHARIQDVLEPQITRLADLTGLDVTGWSRT